MIKFKKIKAKNLMSIGNDGIEIDLSNGRANLIIGTNGAGKSSIITDTLSFALYGKPYRDIPKPLLVNSVNKKHLLVELTFDTGGKSYLIRRGMKPAIFEIYEDDKLIDQNDRVFDYQDKLETEILKMNYTAFKQIVIVGKATYTPFMSLKTQPRRAFIEEILSLSVYTQMALEQRAQNATLKALINENANSITHTKEKLRIIKDNAQKALKTSDDQIRQKRRQLDQTESQYNEAVDQQAKLKEVLDEMLPPWQAEDAEIQKEIKKYTRLSIRVDEKIKTCSKDLAFFEHTASCPVCTQNIGEDFKADKMTTLRDTIEDLESAKTHIATSLDNLKNRQTANAKALKRIDKIKSEILRAHTSISHLNTLTKALIKEMESLEKTHNANVTDSAQIERVKAEYGALLEQKQELGNTQNINRVVSHILKDTGLKAATIKKYIPIINEEIDKYLTAMDFFIQFEIDENFNEIIKSRHRDSFVYNSFSEGEKLRIDIALILVWRAVAKRRNSCATNLLILDELFDSSLDETGVEDLMGLVDLLVGEQQTVYVISHRGEHLIDKFESVLKVTNNKGFTHVAYDE